MTDKPYEFGLQISRRFRGGNNELQVSVSVVRHDDSPSVTPKAPTAYTGVECSAYDWLYPKAKRHLWFGGLEIGGHIFESGGAEPGTRERRLIGFDPRYTEAHWVELRDAERMVKTLRAWQRAIDKWRQANPGVEFHHVHCFNLFAKFAGARWVVFRDYATDRHANDKPVERLSIDQGAYLYRQQVEKWKQEWKGNSWDFKRAS